jgi:hypothetical protein
MYFVFINENRAMKPIETVLRKGGGMKKKGRGGKTKI